MSQQIHEIAGHDGWCYYHSPKTGEIVPKNRKRCCPGAAEPPFYGYQGTCWRKWPEGWVNCPIIEEEVIYVEPANTESILQAPRAESVDDGVAPPPPPVNLRESEVQPTTPKQSRRRMPATNVGSVQLNSSALVHPTPQRIESPPIMAAETVVRKQRSVPVASMPVTVSRHQPIAQPSIHVLQPMESQARGQSVSHQRPEPSLHAVPKKSVTKPPAFTRDFPFKRQIALERTSVVVHADDLSDRAEDNNMRQLPTIARSQLSETKQKETIAGTSENTIGKLLPSVRPGTNSQVMQMLALPNSTTQHVIKKMPDDSVKPGLEHTQNASQHRLVHMIVSPAPKRKTRQFKPVVTYVDE